MRTIRSLSLSLSLSLPLALILAVAAPLAARAQEDTVPAPRRGRIVQPIAGVRIGAPQKLSAYVGFAIAEKRFEGGGYTGWSLTVEPGFGGGLVGIGRTSAGGIGMTVRVRGAALRTWGDPWLVGPDQTYVGADALATVGYVGFSLGGFVRVPEAGADPGVLFSAGIAFGL